MTVQSKIDEGNTVTVALPLVFTPPMRESNIATLTPAARSGSQDSGPKNPIHQVKKSA
jgi:cell cycle sensor histidine kinase DivJ